MMGCTSEFGKGVAWRTITTALPLSALAVLSCLVSVGWAGNTSPGKAKPPKAAWGSAVQGVQVRLRTDKRVWESDEAPTFKLDIRNRGKRKLSIPRDDRFLGLSELEIDGDWFYRLVPIPDIPVKFPPPSPFPPGKQYDDVSSISLGEEWWHYQKGGQRMKQLAPGKHTIRSAFTVYPAEGTEGEPVRAVSESIVIEIREAPWGEPVEGVQVRLRADKPAWKADESPTFKFEIRNRGTRELSVWLDEFGMPSYQLQVDGESYTLRRTLFLNYDPYALPTPLPLGPGKQHELSLSLAGEWCQTTDFAKLLALTPGRHTFRLSVGVLDPEHTDALIPVPSNTVEIEIRPAEEAPWGEPVEGVQVRLRPDKPAWKADEFPTFKYDIRNQGKRELAVWLNDESVPLCLLYVDGEKYSRRCSPVALKIPVVLPPPLPLGPGKQHELSLSLAGEWCRATDFAKLPVLTPGKHTFRLSVGVLDPEHTDALILVPSNTVEVEILPAK